MWQILGVCHGLSVCVRVAVLCHNTDLKAAALLAVILVTSAELINSPFLTLSSPLLYSTHTHSRNSSLPSVWCQAPVRQYFSNKMPYMPVHCLTSAHTLVCRAEWWEPVYLLQVALLVSPLFTIKLFHFSPRTTISRARCHGDTVGLHAMRMETLQRVWLRETHYLTQPSWLMRGRFVSTVAMQQVGTSSQRRRSGQG